MSSDDCSFGMTDRVADELNVSRSLFRGIDSTLCPGGNERQGVYRVTKTGPVMIVSWWDRTGDSRPGSNSNLIGIGYDNAEDMIAAARVPFRRTMERQPKLEPES
jgi:hypothetical protein